MGEARTLPRTYCLSGTMRSHDFMKSDEADQAAWEAAKGAVSGAAKWGVATAILGAIGYAWSPVYRATYSVQGVYTDVGHGAGQHDRCRLKAQRVRGQDENAEKGPARQGQMATVRGRAHERKWQVSTATQGDSSIQYHSCRLLVHTLNPILVLAKR